MHRTMLMFPALQRQRYLRIQRAQAGLEHKTCVHGSGKSKQGIKTAVPGSEKSAICARPGSNKAHPNAVRMRQTLFYVVFSPILFFFLVPLFQKRMIFLAVKRQAYRPVGLLHA